MENHLPLEDMLIFMKTLQGMTMFHRFQRSHHGLVRSRMHSGHTEEFLRRQGSNPLQGHCSVGELHFFNNYSRHIDTVNHQSPVAKASHALEMFAVSRVSNHRGTWHMLSSGRTRLSARLQTIPWTLLSKLVKPPEIGKHHGQ
jgi:hypothetical protein